MTQKFLLKYNVTYSNWHFPTTPNLHFHFHLVGNSPNRDAPQEEHYLTEQLFHCILFIIGTEDHVLL